MSYKPVPRLMSPEEEFNAVGNGVADDTIPLNNMFRAMEAEGGGTAIMPGKYLIRQTLMLPYVPFALIGQYALGKTAHDYPSIITDQLGMNLLAFDVANGVGGSQGIISNLVLGYTSAATYAGVDPSASGVSLPIALDLRYATLMNLNVSFVNCYNCLYAGALRESVLEAVNVRQCSARDDADPNYGFGVKVDCSILNSTFPAKSTGLYAVSIFVNAGGDTNQIIANAALKRFVGLDLLGSSTFNIVKTQLSSCENGLRTRMVDHAVYGQKYGALTCAGVTIAEMSSEGCTHPADIGGAEKFYIVKAQSNQSAGPWILGDNRESYDAPGNSIIATYTGSSSRDDVSSVSAAAIFALNQDLTVSVYLSVGDSSVVAYAGEIDTTGNTHGTTTIDGIPDTSSMHVGMIVVADNILDGTYITSVDSSSQIHISQAALSSVTSMALTVNPTLEAGSKQYIKLLGATYLAGIIPDGTSITVKVTSAFLPPMDTYGGQGEFGILAPLACGQGGVLVQSGLWVLNNLQALGCGTAKSEFTVTTVSPSPPWALLTTTTVTLKNKGIVTVYYKMGDINVTASTSDTALAAGATAAVSIGANTYIAAVTASGLGDLLLQYVAQFDTVTWMGGGLEIDGGAAGNKASGQFSDKKSRYGLNMVGTDQLATDDVTIHDLDVNGNLSNPPVSIANTNLATIDIRNCPGLPGPVFYSNTMEGACNPLQTFYVADTTGVTLSIASSRFGVSRTKNNPWVVRSGPTANFIDTLDTAANIIGAIPSAIAGYSFTAVFVNISAKQQQISASGTNIDISAVAGMSGNIEIAAGATAQFVFQITSTGTPAIAVVT